MWKTRLENQIKDLCKDLDREKLDNKLKQKEETLIDTITK